MIKISILYTYDKYFNAVYIRNFLPNTQRFHLWDHKLFSKLNVIRVLIYRVMMVLLCIFDGEKMHFYVHKDFCICRCIRMPNTMVRRRIWTTLKRSTASASRALAIVCRASVGSPVARGFQGNSKRARTPRSDPLILA